MSFNNPTPLTQVSRDLFIHLPGVIADASVGGIETTYFDACRCWVILEPRKRMNHHTFNGMMYHHRV